MFFYRTSFPRIRQLIAHLSSVEETPDSLEDVDKDANQTKKSKPVSLRDIPKLTKEMIQHDSESEEQAIDAARKLYELCDVAHKSNREPMVASGKYDVLHPLADCLLHKNEKKLHYVCLTLNNLSVPLDNKRVMTLERVATKLIQNLCKVIASGSKSAYLCLICLTNLAYYPPAEPVIGQFSPRTGRKKIPPLENPDSLLRILQDLTAHAVRGTSDFRWAFGLLATLAKHPENALLIGLTAIPTTAIENIKSSKTPPSEWKMNSLEDFSLFLILHLSETSIQHLETAVEVVEPIMTQLDSDTTIQGLKATMICAFLGVPWKTYPNFGVNATGCISELIANTFERVGKKHSYENNVFGLHTAVKAYGELARAAAKVDEETSHETCTCTKVVALPTTVALLFQIIEYIVNQTTEDDDDHDMMYDHLSIQTGELAVMAIIPILPALLQMEQTQRDSTHTETASTEISQLFAQFSRKTKNTHLMAKSGETAGRIWESSKSALPLLEASYDLWKMNSAAR